MYVCANQITIRCLFCVFYSSQYRFCMQTLHELGAYPLVICATENHPCLKAAIIYVINVQFAIAAWTFQRKGKITRFSYGPLRLHQTCLIAQPWNTYRGFVHGGTPKASKSRCLCIETHGFGDLAFFKTPPAYIDLYSIVMYCLASSPSTSHHIIVCDLGRRGCA